MDDSLDCRTCGACCSYSSEWPRFSTEDEAQLQRIPVRYVARDGGGMRCAGARCSALLGSVGQSTSCGVYDVRPDVCRACMPGDDECLTARRALGVDRSGGSAIPAPAMANSPLMCRTADLF
jgi:uncharacterized protein